MTHRHNVDDSQGWSISSPRHRHVHTSSSGRDFRTTSNDSTRRSGGTTEPTGSTDSRTWNSFGRRSKARTQQPSASKISAAVISVGDAAVTAPGGAAVDDLLDAPFRPPPNAKLRGNVVLTFVAATVLFLVGGHQLGKYGDSRDVPGPLGALARLKSRKVAAKHREEWRASVNKCTGPDDGYVFGGETANVLNFIHKGRGASSSNNYVDARAGSGAATFPSLSEVLRWVWNAKRERGVLAYKVETLTSRRAKGEESGWECILAANFGRHKQFPPAGPAEDPWDPSSFNFYKADPKEFVLEYTPSFRHEEKIASAAVPAAAAAMIGSGETATGNDKSLAGKSTKRGVLRGAARPDSAIGAPSVHCGEASTTSPPQDAVLVNIRPVGPVSVLLTPGYALSNNQRAKADSLAVAMDFAEALRSDPGFRLGFNSGGSSASVNHLHFQCWYFDAGPSGFPIEASKTLHAKTVPLPPRSSERRTPPEGKDDHDRSSVDAVEVHTLVDYPIRALVFHSLGKDLESVGEVIEKCINYLLDKDTPHTMLFSTGRAFLLPRQPLQEPPFAAVPGFPEVSGEVIITAEEDYPRLTGDDIFNWWHDKISVDADHFESIVNGCLN